MPTLMREFLCDSCGKMQERFIDTTVHYVDCDCGGKARKIVGMPTVKLEGITGAFPGAHERWARIREEKARIDKRRS